MEIRGDADTPDDGFLVMMQARNRDVLENRRREEKSATLARHADGLTVIPDLKSYEDAQMLGSYFILSVCLKSLC